MDILLPESTGWVNNQHWKPDLPFKLAFMRYICLKQMFHSGDHCLFGIRQRCELTNYIHPRTFLSIMFAVMVLYLSISFWEYCLLLLHYHSEGNVVPFTPLLSKNCGYSLLFSWRFYIQHEIKSHIILLGKKSRTLCQALNKTLSLRHYLEF